MISLTSAGPSTLTYGTDARIDHDPNVARTENGTTTALVLVVSPYLPSEYCTPLEAGRVCRRRRVTHGASAVTTAPASRDLEAVMSCDLSRCPLSVPGAVLVVLSIAIGVAGAAAVVVSVFAVTVFAPVLTPILAAILTAWGLVGLAGCCGCGAACW